MNVFTKKGTTAMEYLLLLAIVAATILIAMPTQLPRIFNAAETYFNRAGNMILGEPPRCGDGVCHPTFENNEKCCDDCFPGC